jgi:exosortase
VSEPASEPKSPSFLERVSPWICWPFLLAATHWSTLDWLVGRWRTDPFYSHGPLVPVVSIALLWTRRHQFRARPEVTPLALGVLIFSAVLHLLGVRLLFEFLSAISIIGLFAGGCLLAGGRDFLKTAAFPLLYLLFAIPLPMIVLQQVSLPLQLFSTVCAQGALAALGCDVARHGVLLIFPKFTLAVADACSGLRSLLTVLAISTLAAHLSAGTLARKSVLVLFSSIAALLVNILRIALSGLIGLAFDGETACLIFEKYSGYFFFALVVLSTVGVFKLVSPGASPAAAPDREPRAPVPWQAFRWTVVIPLFAVVLPMGGAAKLLQVGRKASAPTLLSGWRPSIAGWETAEVQSRPAFPGEEQLTGLLRSGAGTSVRFNVLHSVNGRYLHSPEACSLAAGWIPERQSVDAGSIHLWILRRGTERACVIFWFDLGGKLRRGSIDQHLGALGQRLVRGAIDSAYAEIVLPLPPGTKFDERALVNLSRALHGEVERRLWPAR